MAGSLPRQEPLDHRPPWTGDDLGGARTFAYLTRMPIRNASSADTDAMVAEVAPAILALLADGVPRSRQAIIAALAGRHPKDDVRRTLMRLAVTERLVEQSRKYTLPPMDGVGRR
jgi:hypothetical protein